MKRIEFHAMGSRILAILDSETTDAELALQDVPGWFAEWEQAFSRFRPDSELSFLNYSNGQPVVVSENLAQVFQAAREAEEFTGGLVRPTMLDALVQAGYDRSFEGLFQPRAAALASLLDLPCSSFDISWDESSRTINLPYSVQLDFGGVAKGWAAQQAVNKINAFGPCLMDAGGDISISEKRADGQPWSVGIRDPFNPDTYFESLRLEGGGVATSGTDYHHWLQGGTWNHHLIDPRTGLPVVSDVLTATIIAPDILHAEAAAKAVVISGSHSGLEWLEAQSSLACVLVLQTGETIYSQRMADFLWRNI